MNRTRYTFFIDDDLKRGLEALHERDGISASEAIRRAVAAFIKERGIYLKEAKGGTRPKKPGK